MIYFVATALLSYIAGFYVSLFFLAKTKYHKFDSIVCSVFWPGLLIAAPFVLIVFVFFVSASLFYDNAQKTDKRNP